MGERTMPKGPKPKKTQSEPVCPDSGKTAKAAKDKPLAGAAPPPPIGSLTCPTTPYSFAKDIVPLFRPKDVTCMQNAEGFTLTNYTDAVSWAQDIYTQVSTGKMPLGGPKWTQDMWTKFGCWVQQGCKP